MTNILVVERLTIFNLFIVIFYKIFKFEVYIFKSSKKLANGRLSKFLSFQVCNFEDCFDINFNYYGGKNGDAIDEVTRNFINSDISNSFLPFFTNIKDFQKKHKLLVKEYVLGRCTNLNDIYIWIEGYFINHKENSLNIYILGDICKVGAQFLKIRSNSIKVSPVLSTNLIIVFKLSQRLFSSLYQKILTIIYGAIPSKSKKHDTSQLSFISNNVDTLIYKVLYFPHQSIFYGDLFVKDNFYSEEIDSSFHPSNILHIELENINITKDQLKYYKDKDISTMILPKLEARKLYKYLIYILSEIGLKKMLLFLRKDFILFCVFLLNAIKFLSTKDLIKKNFNAKIVLVGYDILFPKILSLAFESLKIRTISTQERLMPTFFSHFSFSIDTYLCNSQLVFDTIKTSNDKFVNNLIPCGQIRSDTLINYKKNITNKNERFTIVAFDYESNSDFDANRLRVCGNWSQNIIFYKDLCSLAEEFPQVDIIIRGKNVNWISIPFFKDVLNMINATSNVWIDEDYSKLNRQYKLASRSDLVIAKYTSIGDEVMALGKRVIYYDYFPNSTHYFASEYFKYNNYNVYAYSYIQLEQMVQSILNGFELLTDAEVLELQILINNAPADGKAKHRVMKALDTIYAETCL
ncbi:hypothetical protein [Candidatus Thioglobus sp. NP1]|uniref:hypothetical protein n=1 Tax=Candidatus Thioglobus sp. NP1 TaxID=2508687 RepID=UPI000DEDA0D3|nr:hypothetical protein [Candidatus Thioglobus sp. NP1]AXE61693.1 hypothetical protein CRN91_03250 [Candidatus Thioglobus sp. NP1]